MAADLRKLKDKAAELSAKGKLEKAADVYREILQAEPRDVAIRQKLAEVLRRAGEVAEAVRAYALVAERFAKDGLLIKAIAICKTILELDPRHDATQAMLAELYGKRAAVEVSRPPPRTMFAMKAVTAPVVPPTSELPPELEIERGVSIPLGPPPEVDFPEADEPAMEVTAPDDPFLRAGATQAWVPPANAIPLDDLPAVPEPAEESAFHRIMSAAGQAVEAGVEEDVVIDPDVPDDFGPIDVDASFDEPPELTPVEAAAAEVVLEVEPPPAGDLELEPVETLEPIDVEPPAREALPPLEVEVLPEAPKAPVSAPAAASASSPGAPPERPPVITQIPRRPRAPAQPPRAPAPPPAAPAARPAAGPRLPRVPLFSDLGREAFVALTEGMVLHRFGAGEAVLREGETGASFYVVASGTFSVWKRDETGGAVVLAHLGEGEFFGEMALLSGAPRAATVAAEGTAEVLEIPAALLQQIAARHPHVADSLRRFYRQRLLANAMAVSPLFRPFGRGERKLIMERFRTRDVAAGEVIVREGDRSDGLYVILDGTVDVVKQHAGQALLVGRLREGDLFGEVSCLRKSAATATVQSRRAGTLLKLPRADFDELVMSYPQILELVSTLSEERLENLDAILSGHAQFTEDGLVLI